VRCLPAGAWALACAGGLLACSPTFNWREVRLEPLRTMLPCKPDEAQRTVRLGAREVRMGMVGCEAGGSLFAVSHVQVPDAGQADVLLTDWQAASLQALQASKVVEQAAVPGPGRSMPVRVLDASGVAADGTALQARLAWWRSGGDVFQIAVYAKAVTPEMTETLFSETRLP